MSNEVNKEERLLKVLNNVNDWLKFAESKNAMLIAFNAASIFGAAQLSALDSVKKSELLINYIIIVVIILVFSTVVSMLSFVPRIKILKGGLYAPSKVRNRLFYEYLKGQNEVQIIQQVCETTEGTFKEFEIDIANQIQQNASIASKKFSYFTIAVWLTLCAYVTFPVALVFCIFTYTNPRYPER